MAKDIAKKGLLAVIIIHSILFLLKVVFISVWDLELHYEEAQYWLWGEHLDWSYYSKPGMVAWMNALSTSIFGDTELGVKFPALIAGWLMGLGTYVFAKDMFDNHKLALLASLILYLMPFYYSVTFFHSTDTFLCCFLLFSFVFLQKALKNGKISNWLLFGLFFGLAMLSKYAAIFIIPASLVLLIGRNKLPKHAWRNWGLALLLGVICCAPIFIWNAQHDWVTFKHVFALGGGGGGEKSYSILKILNALAEYIGGQAAIISPFLVLLYLFYKKSSISKENKRFLIVFPLIAFLFFFIVTIFKQKAANVNWSMWGYITLPILFAVAFQKLNWKKWVLPMAVVQVIFIAWIAFFKQGNLLPITLKKDPRMTYVGWEETAKLAWELKQSSADPENTIIATSSYQAASAIEFYLRKYGKETVHYISDGSRMNQHALWNTIKPYANNKDQMVVYVSKWQLPANADDFFEDIVSCEENKVVVKDIGEVRFQVCKVRGTKTLDLKPAGY